MPGIGDEIEGAMQHAPQWERHSISKLKMTPVTRSSPAARRVILAPTAGTSRIGETHDCTRTRPFACAPVG
jgi:hypothetical protein